MPVELLEGLEFTWTRTAEMLGFSRWAVHRRVLAEYGLENMRSFDYLPDERLDRIIHDYINNHGSACGCNMKSLGLRIQRRRVRERLAKLDGVLPYSAGRSTRCLGQTHFGILNRRTSLID